MPRLALIMQYFLCMDEVQQSNIPDVLDSAGIPCKKILCWVCSTDKRDTVVPVAQALAKLGGGKCHVVMGLDAPFRTLPKPEHSIPLTPEIISQAKHSLAELYGEGGETIVLPGKPVFEVLRYAQNVDADLIVIGEKSLILEKDCWEELAYTAPCAVMILFLPTIHTDQNRLPPEHSRLNSNKKES